MVNTLKLHRLQKLVANDNRRFRVIVAGRRWGKCLAPDSRITMADGSIKTIAEIKPGIDAVMTLNEDTYVMEPAPVKALMSNGVRKTVTVKTSSRSIRCTPNHPFLVNNSWTEAKDIRSGDLVAVMRESVFGRDAMPLHDVEYLAIWLAEGEGHNITNGTPAIVSALRNAVNQMPGLYLRQRDEITWHVTTGRGPGKFDEQAYDTVLLKRLGLFGKNSKTKFIPEEIFRLPQKQLARFLNLFIACDGCITRRSGNAWSLEIGLANELMVRQIAELLMKFGIRGSIREKTHRAKGRQGENFKSWTFVSSDRDSMVRFARSIGALSKERQVADALNAALKSAGSANDYLPVSHDQFVERLDYQADEIGTHGGHNCVVARGMPKALRDGLNSWRKQTQSRVSRRRYQSLRGFSDGFYDPIADGDVVWEEVVSVEASGECETYDLHIDGNHNFFANGIATHNSQLSRISLVIAAATKQKQLVWYVAPTYQMARGILWDDLKESIPRQWIAVGTGGLRINETRMSIHLKNGSRIELKGADKPDTLRGVGLHFAVIDEAQDIKEDTWEKVLRPTLATTNGRALFIGCVNGKTKVLPRTGFRSIESFTRGSPAKTLDPMQVDFYGLDRSFHTADGFWNNGTVETRKIRTRWGFSLEASLPHPVWVMGVDGVPGWKRTEDLVVGDRIAIARGMEVWGQIDPLAGWQDRVRAWRDGFSGKRGPKPVPLPVDPVMSADLAYFLGLWIAEGSVEKKTGRVTITCGDASVGAFLTSGAVLGLPFRARPGRNDQWSVNSLELVELLRHLDMPLVKAPQKTLPSWLTAGRRDWACHFVAGMWDGDGTVPRNCKRAVYGSASRELVADLQLLLTNLGIIGRVSTHDQPATARAVASVQHRYTIQGANLRLFRDAVRLRITRKQQALDEQNLATWSRRDGVPHQASLLRAVRNAMRRRHQDLKIDAGSFSAALETDADISYRTLKMFLDTHPDEGLAEHAQLRRNLADHYYWDRIEALEKSEAETFDFTIPDTHSFWSNGFISHNTPKSFNWLYDRFMQGQAGDMVLDEKGKLVRNEWKSWQFPTITSPFIPRKEIIQARRDMDPKSFQQEFEASFLTMSGRVYYPFDRHVHVQECKFNPRLPIFIGMDFNIDPMSAVILQEQDNGEIWAVDECVLYGSNVQETADEIARRYFRYMAQITIYPDPAGNNRNHDRGETSLDILREAGFKNILFKRKHPLVQDRVNTVNRLLRSAEGEVILKIDPKCRKFIESLEQTTYKEGTSEIDKKKSVEHVADAFGYFADYRHPMRKTRILGVSI